MHAASHQGWDWIICALEGSYFLIWCLPLLFLLPPPLPPSWHFSFLFSNSFIRTRQLLSDISSFSADLNSEKHSLPSAGLPFLYGPVVVNRHTDSGSSDSGSLAWNSARTSITSPNPHSKQFHWLDYFLLCSRCWFTFWGKIFKLYSKMFSCMYRSK